MSFDRNTLKRVRKIVDTKEGGVIDLSFGDEFTEEAGFANSFLTYLEIMPFVDKIHLKGKACDENCDADYKLVALSGKPFGMNTH